jgi:hypothetical protein
MLLRASLPASLFVELLWLATPASAFDRPIAAASAPAASACAGARGPVLERCLLETSGASAERVLSDHGFPYDAQGNLLDRHGNILAVPEGRHGAGPWQAREVFVREPHAVQ